ncbi:hypothetical protein CR513_50982, partial [Mucuna pruriens]
MKGMNMSSRSLLGERHERHGRVERNKRKERRERHGRKDEESREEELEMSKLYQGSKSVQEYHKEMEMDLMRAQIRKSKKTTLAWFLHGLNKEIQDVIELQHYRTLGERSASRNTYNGTSGWKGKDKEKERARREKSPKKESEALNGRKEVTFTPTPMTPRTSSIKCFKCLGKGHIASQLLLPIPSVSLQAQKLKNHDPPQPCYSKVLRVKGQIGVQMKSTQLRLKSSWLDEVVPTRRVPLQANFVSAY